MSEVDLESEGLNLTVGEMIEIIAHLEPTLKLITAYRSALADANYFKQRLQAHEKMFAEVVRERDELLKGKKHGS